MRKVKVKVEKYYTRDREAGNIIDSFYTQKQAEKAIEKYEKEDKKDNCFEENFYEIKKENWKNKKSWLCQAGGLRNE